MSQSTVRFPDKNPLYALLRVVFDELFSIVNLINPLEVDTDFA